VDEFGVGGQVLVARRFDGEILATERAEHVVGPSIGECNVYRHRLEPVVVPLLDRQVDDVVDGIRVADRLDHARVLSGSVGVVTGECVLDVVLVESEVPHDQPDVPDHGETDYVVGQLFSSHR